MFVTNLTNVRLGIRGPLIMNPREKNLFIDDKNTVVVEAVMRLKAANLVSVVREQGLEKSSPGKVVKEIKKATPKQEDVVTIKQEVNTAPPVEKVVEQEKPVEEIPTKEETKEEVADTNEQAAQEEAVEEKPAKKKKRK